MRKYAILLTLTPGHDPVEAYRILVDVLGYANKEHVNALVQRAEAGERVRLAEGPTKASVRPMYDRFVARRDNMDALEPSKRFRPQGIYFLVTEIKGEVDQAQGALFDELADCPLAVGA